MTDKLSVQVKDFNGDARQDVAVPPYLHDFEERPRTGLCGFPYEVYDGRRSVSLWDSLSCETTSPFDSKHRDPRCRYLVPLAFSAAGDFASVLVSNHSGRRPQSEDRWRAGTLLNENRQRFANLIDEHLANNLGAEVTVDLYTLRGRKRRGLKTKQRRPLLRVDLGAGESSWHYFPGVAYDRGELRVTRDRVTARCYCSLQNSGGRTFTLWQRKP